MNKLSVLKKFLFNIVFIVMLFVCFLITTFALRNGLMSVDYNLFKTGRIKINLNDGQSIIDDDGFLFEPGMTVMKEFFVENESTFDVYYKVYFTDVDGGLADVIDVTIKNDDKILYEGTVNELNRKNVTAVDEALKINEKVNLTVYFHYPEHSQNNTQNSDIYFRLGVDAVQTKNNPNKVFD